ncbi:MAG: CAP domain-containing protein, partial [Bacillota bacterium]
MPVNRRWMVTALVMATMLAHLLLSTASVAASGEPVADGTAAEELLSTDEQKMLSLINEAREAEGLEPISLSGDLCAAARGHAEEMIEMNYFSHRSPRTGSAGDRVR